MAVETAGRFRSWTSSCVDWTAFLWSCRLAPAGPPRLAPSSCLMAKRYGPPTLRTSSVQPTTTTTAVATAASRDTTLLAQRTKPNG